MNEKETMLKAEAYCSAGERCRSEVLAKIGLWDKTDELTSAAVSRIMEHLEKEPFETEYGVVGMVRDKKNAFEPDKLMFCKWGRVKIRAALRQKSVQREAVDAALDGIDEDEYLGILRELIASKRREIRGATEYERSMKLLRFVAQRGFEPAIAARIADIQETD